MFDQSVPKSPFRSVSVLAELIFYEAVKSVRSQDGNALVALLKSVMTIVLMVAFFYGMSYVMGMKSSPLRGSYILYVFSGVFVYISHVQTLSAVAGAMGPSSAMMQHAPMNTAVALAGAALGALYITALSAAVILPTIYIFIEPFKVDDPIGFTAMVIISWAFGVAVGLVFYAIKPWAPSTVTILQQMYSRINMIASGKMFVANTLPAFMLSMFDWNPLFHLVDQGRGFMFNNYFPHNSDYMYAIYVGLVVFAVGLMLEFKTRRSASASWEARR